MKAMRNGIWTTPTITAPKLSRLKLYVDVCGLPRTSSAYLHENANYNEGWWKGKWEELMRDYTYCIIVETTEAVAIPVAASTFENLCTINNGVSCNWRKQWSTGNEAKHLSPTSNLKVTQQCTLCFLSIWVSVGFPRVFYTSWYRDRDVQINSSDTMHSSEPKAVQYS